MTLQVQKNVACGYSSRPMGTFGDNVRRLREAVGLKGVELAERVGVTPPVVSAWENNRTGLPETPTVLKLAKALGVSVEELLDGIDQDYDRVKVERALDTMSKVQKMYELEDEATAGGKSSTTWAIVAALNATRQSFLRSMHDDLAASGLLLGPTPSKEEQDLLKEWRDLTDDQRASFLRVIRDSAGLARRLGSNEEKKEERDAAAGSRRERPLAK